VLYRWRSTFTTVSVHTALVGSEPAHTLLAQSCGAAQLVVDCGRGQVMGTVLGSVSDTVLHPQEPPMARLAHSNALLPPP
jgi:hypothetical protein